MAYAESGYLTTWNNLYPSSASGTNAGCQLCHGTSTGDINPYGFDIATCAGNSGTISSRIQAAEGINSDGDTGGFTNLQETNASTQPGWTTGAIPVWGRNNCTSAGTNTAPTNIGMLDPAAPECTIDADCNDGVACTIDLCIAGTCENTPNDAFCNDGQACTGTELCDAQNDCQAGTPVQCPPGDVCEEPGGTCVTPPECVIDADCNDGVACTIDVCNAGTCENTPDDGFCDDGLACTGTELCDAQNDCQAGTPVQCPPGEVCEEPGMCVADNDKVTICHIPPGNPAKARTLSIGADSVADHLDHGDTLGPCP